MTIKYIWFLFDALMLSAYPMPLFASADPNDAAEAHNFYISDSDPIKNPAEAEYVSNIENTLYYLGAPKEVYGTFFSGIDYNNARGRLEPELNFLKYKSDHTDMAKALGYAKEAWVSTDTTVASMDGGHFRPELIDIALKYRFLSLGVDIGIGEKELTERFVLKYQRFESLDKFKEYCRRNKAAFNYSILRHLNAYILYRGIGIEKDPELADSLIKYPNDSGSWKSFYMGYLLPKDRELAVRILEKNAELDDLTDVWILTYLYDGYFDAADRNAERKAFWEKRKNELLEAAYQKAINWRKECIENYDPAYLDNFPQRIPDKHSGKSSTRYNYDGLNPAILALKAYGADKFGIATDPIELQVLFRKNPLEDRQKAEEINQKLMTLNDPLLYFYIGKDLYGGNKYNIYLQELALAYIKKAAEMKLRAAEYFLEKHFGIN